MKRLIGPVLVVMLVLAACGDGGTSTDGVASLEATTATTTATTTPDIDQEAAVISLVECLREEGLDINDPEVGADGNVDMRSLFRQSAQDGQFDREDVQAALEICDDELSAVALGFTRDFDLTEIQDQLVVWAQCMRDNGYQMDDPDLSNFGAPGQGGGQGGGPFGDIDPEDPDFISALEACEDVQPGIGRGAGAAPGGRP